MDEIDLFFIFAENLLVRHKIFIEILITTAINILFVNRGSPYRVISFAHVFVTRFESYMSFFVS